jgi:hypothetical protein
MTKHTSFFGVRFLGAGFFEPRALALVDERFAPGEEVLLARGFAAGAGLADLNFFAEALGRRRAGELEVFLAGAITGPYKGSGHVHKSQRGNSDAA